jgi:hypothetical protein
MEELCGCELLHKYGMRCQQGEIDKTIVALTNEKPGWLARLTSPYYFGDRFGSKVPADLLSTPVLENGAKVVVRASVTAT